MPTRRLPLRAGWLGAERAVLGEPLVDFGEKRAGGEFGEDGAGSLQLCGRVLGASERVQAAPGGEQRLAFFEGEAERAPEIGRLRVKLEGVVEVACCFAKHALCGEHGVAVTRRADFQFGEKALAEFWGVECDGEPDGVGEDVRAPDGAFAGGCVEFGEQRLCRFDLAARVGDEGGARERGRADLRVVEFTRATQKLFKGGESSGGVSLPEQDPRSVGQRDEPVWSVAFVLAIPSDQLVGAFEQLVPVT